MHRTFIPLIALVLTGCGSDIKISSAASCDGVLQGQEETVDSVFDADGDGFFDIANPDCSATYEAKYLDCDDGDPDINPGSAELACDGIDNDCDEETADSLDQDEDGYTDCEECDDSNAEISPGIGEISCDGLDNDCDDTTPDGVDQDGDGWTECSDCDDTTIYLSPGLEEILCDGLDNDCSEETPDAEDFDNDGAMDCVDCDDDDAERSPEYEEVCDDDIDNDCDDDIDEDCSYTGTWLFDQNVTYQCAYYYVFYLVDISFNGVYIADYDPSITLSPSNGASQPGTVTGTFTSGDTFSSTNTISGSCSETYSFTGAFTDSETMEGVFQASFSGSCFDCSNQSWSFTATKQ
ncbi:MAG: hypothetical protein ACI8RZ_007439 [Myxococcota bacterium]|jgi:hypothetical protein